jgi:hypothetical protein
MSRRAFDAPRLVDNPFEDPHYCVSLERAACLFPMGLHMVQHLFLTIGLIHLEPEGLLQFPDLERALGTLAEQLDQPFIKLVDPQPELVDGHGHQMPRLPRKTRLTSVGRILFFGPVTSKPANI